MKKGVIIINKVILIGNLTRDPELKKYTNQKGEGCYIAETLAVTTKNANGENIATFIDFKIWGKRAETLAKFTKKGSKLALEGSISIDTYQTKDGINKKAFYVSVENFVFLGGNTKLQQENTTQLQNVPEPQFDISDEDLPF